MTDLKLTPVSIHDEKNIPSNQMIPYLSNEPNGNLTTLESLVTRSNFPNLWLNFGTGNADNYAIIALSNNNQINIEQFLKVTPNTQTSIPINRIINIDNLDKDLVLCLVPSPYQKLEDNEGNVNDIDFPI